MPAVRTPPLYNAAVRLAHLIQHDQRINLFSYLFQRGEDVLLRRGAERLPILDVEPIQLARRLPPVCSSGLV